MIKYFTIEDLLKHYLQKKFHILLYVKFWGGILRNPALLLRLEPFLRF